MVEFSYDNVVDALYIHFSREQSKLTEEIGEGIIVDYNSFKSVIGIEILDFSKRSINLNDIITKNANEIIPLIIKC